MAQSVSLWLLGEMQEGGVWLGRKSKRDWVLVYEPAAACWTAESEGVAVECGRLRRMCRGKMAKLVEQIWGLHNV